MEESMQMMTAILMVEARGAIEKSGEKDLLVMLKVAMRTAADTLLFENDHEQFKAAIAAVIPADIPNGTYHMLASILQNRDIFFSLMMLWEEIKVERKAEFMRRIHSPNSIGSEGRETK